jgi:hypothetical protein
MLLPENQNGLLAGQPAEPAAPDRGMERPEERPEECRGRAARPESSQQNINPGSSYG